MRSFGRRPNSADFALLVQFGCQPISCKVVERTLRVIRVTLSDPRRVAQRFTLVVNNGTERVYCQTISYGEDYVTARYVTQESADQFGLTNIVASLSEAERWKGAA